MKPQRKAAYHHGDLKDALVGATRDIIEQDGLDHFTMRESARRAGVSHGAPAHHFGDKTGLLTELAVQTMNERLAFVEAYCAKADPDPMSQLKACGLANIDYILAHPQLDALCSRSDQLDWNNPALKAAGEQLAANLIARMSAATGMSLHPDKEANPSTLVAMAVVHGFASMVNDRAILRDVPDAERPARAHELAEQMLDFMAGLFTKGL